MSGVLGISPRVARTHAALMFPWMLRASAFLTFEARHQVYPAGGARRAPNMAADVVGGEDGRTTCKSTAAPACPGSMAVPQWLLFPQWWLLPACPGSSVVPQWLLFPQWGLFETSCLPLLGSLAALQGSHKG